MKLTANEVLSLSTICSFVGIYELSELFLIYALDSDDKVVCVFEGEENDNCETEWVYSDQDIGRPFADVWYEMADGGITAKPLKR